MAAASRASRSLHMAEENWEEWQKADKLVDTDPEKAEVMARAQ